MIFPMSISLVTVLMNAQLGNEFLQESPIIYNTKVK